MELNQLFGALISKDQQLSLQILKNLLQKKKFESLKEFDENIKKCQNQNLKLLMNTLSKFLHKQSFEEYLQILNVLNQIFKEESDWIIGIVRYFVQRGKLILSETKDQEDYNRLVERIRDLLGTFQSSKSDYRNKQGTLFCLNELFFIFFKLYNYNQCKSFILLVQNSLKNDISIFTKAEQIKYKYYSGRINFFESKYYEAQQCLNFCYQQTSHYQCSNKMKIQKLILKYLIPLNMHFGIFPKDELLQKFRLIEYSDIVQCLKTRNLVKFKDSYHKNQMLWIKRGLLIFMSTLQLLLIRNIFKKAFLSYRDIFDSFQIDLDIFKIALELKDNRQYDIEETECLLGNLIFQGYIKGYISHELKKIVFSKSNAFPKLSEVHAN